MIKNIIIRDIDGGEFDYAAEGFEVEIVDVFEDGIEYVDVNGEVVVKDCIFENGSAIIQG